jgi:hypothetical protein
MGGIHRRAVTGFLASKQNHGSRIFKGGSEVETVVTCGRGHGLVT